MVPPACLGATAKEAFLISIRQDDDVITGVADGREEFAWNEVDLTQVKVRVVFARHLLPHMLAGVGVAVDAVPFISVIWSAPTC
ncbi:hypothetical protein ABIF62_003102 [Bradyrhizobium japonicum]